MCRRSQETRKRQVENSPLLAILTLCRETELGQRTPLWPTTPLPLFWKFQSLSWLKVPQFGVSVGL